MDKYWFLLVVVIPSLKDWNERDIIRTIPSYKSSFYSLKIEYYFLCVYKCACIFIYFPSLRISSFFKKKIQFIYDKASNVNGYFLFYLFSHSISASSIHRIGMKKGGTLIHDHQSPSSHVIWICIGLVFRFL